MSQTLADKYSFWVRLDQLPSNITDVFHRVAVGDTVDIQYEIRTVECISRAYLLDVLILAHKPRKTKCPAPPLNLSSDTIRFRGKVSTTPSVDEEISRLTDQEKLKYR